VIAELFSSDDASQAASGAERSGGTGGAPASDAPPPGDFDLATEQPVDR
jgi:hypothetical protein